jgi:hypothetical protein
VPARSGQLFEPPFSIGGAPPGGQPRRSPAQRVWRKSLQDEDREKAFAAAEVGTLLNLRRALRNGSVWIDHSLSFRSRETLFIPPARWQTSRRAYDRRLHLPQDCAAFLEPLIERAKAGVLAVSKTAADGILRVDEELHLTPLEPMADDPKVTKLRAALDRRMGEAQLPELIWPSMLKFASAGSCWGERRLAQACSVVALFERFPWRGFLLGRFLVGNRPGGSLARARLLLSRRCFWRGPFLRRLFPVL